MNRYQIAQQRGVKSVAQISDTRRDSPTALYESMIKCVSAGIDLEINNIDEGLLDHCLIKICKKYDAPLIVDNPRRVQLIRITQNYKKVFAAGHIPPKTVKVVVYYDVGDLPDFIRPILRVRKSPA